MKFLKEECFKSFLEDLIINDGVKVTSSEIEFQTAVPAAVKQRSPIVVSCMGSECAPKASLCTQPLLE